MLIDFEEEIVNQLTEKSNYLSIDHRFISPMILQTARLGQDFYIVSSTLWNKLSKQYNSRYPIITFTFKEYDINPTQKIEYINGLICPIAHRQIQIIFCTSKTGTLFIGFLPQQSQLISLIRLIMKELRLIEKPQSKLSFLQINPQNSTYLSSFTSKKVKQLSQGQQFIMIINLLSQLNQDEFIIQNALNTSTEAINKSINMQTNFNIFQQDLAIVRPDHKTISTGASTPLTFSINSAHQNDYEFQLVNMLREKTQQQIDQLRSMANKSIQSQLILVDHSIKQQTMKDQLLSISQQLIDLVNFCKKKIKDKQYY